MPSIKSKFTLDQQVSVIKSGKTGTVKAIVHDSKGTQVDVQMPASKRPWRYAETDLQTLVEAARAAKARLKSAKPVVVKAEKPAKAVKAAKAPAKAAPVKAKKKAK